MLWLLLAVVVAIAVWALARGAAAKAAENAAKAGYARALQDVRDAITVEGVDETSDPRPGKKARSTRMPGRPSVAPEFDYWAHPPGVLSSQADISAALRKAPKSGPEVCFTGWPDDDEADLIRRAQSAGFRIRTAVTKNLTILCVGATPGPVKVEKAHAQAVAVVSGRTMEAIMEAWGQEVGQDQG